MRKYICRNMRRRKNNGYSICAQCILIILGCCASFTIFTVVFLFFHTPHKHVHGTASSSLSTINDDNFNVRGGNHNEILNPKINHMIYDNNKNKNKNDNNNNNNDNNIYQSSNTKIALLVRIREMKRNNDNIEAFFDSLFQTLSCDLKNFNVVILFGYDKIALPFLENKKYQNYVKKQLFQNLKMKLIRHIEEEELEWSHHHRRKGNIDNIENMKMKFYPYQTSNPCYIWNHLAKEAYDVEKADYFYQLNSNSFLLSSCTLTKLTNILLKKELIPNFGIAAALDPQYKRVITKAFFSKMHMDIFKGQFLPIPPSKKWCSDQEYYLSHVYGKSHTFLTHFLLVTSNNYNKRHSFEEQMAKPINQMSHQHIKWLFKEIKFGRRIIRKYLKSKFDKKNEKIRR